MAAALACCVVAQVHAQPANKPGGMQSGQHVAAPEAASAAAQPTVAPAATPFDPRQLFANVCGWCHSSGGREAGKGPRLMDSQLTDAELTHRIKMGKTGQMPAFGSALTEPQIAAVVSYIRNLKPESPQ